MMTISPSQSPSLPSHGSSDHAAAAFSPFMARQPSPSSVPRTIPRAPLARRPLAVAASPSGRQSAYRYSPTELKTTKDACTPLMSDPHAASRPAEQHSRRPATPQHELASPRADRNHELATAAGGMSAAAEKMAIPSSGTAGESCAAVSEPGGAEGADAQRDACHQALAPTQIMAEVASPTGGKRRGSADVAIVETRMVSGQVVNSSKRVRANKSAATKLPLLYEDCPVEDLVILMADMISELIDCNDHLPLQPVELTRFHSRTAPAISVPDYLARLAKHATLTPPLLLSMVFYIDKLCALYPAFTITSLTIHRFLITAATVAAKGLSDSFWNNTTYARVGGLKLAELGMLELEFLHRVDWRIVPVPETLVDYYNGLVGRSSKYELEEEPVNPEDAAEGLKSDKDDESSKVEPEGAAGAV